MSGHTPGPWGIRKNSRPSPDTDFEVWAPQSGKLLFLPTGGAYRHEREREANARLIATAPDMLATLMEVERYCPVAVQDRIRALLASVGPLP